MTGYEVTRYLRQTEPYTILPVLVLTTKAQAQLRVEALRAGGDDYLVKPVAPEVLLTTVAARLERSRQLRALLARDGLTHLLTRTAFQERLQTAIAKKRRTPTASTAFVMIDIDHFKVVNDTHGHLAGDRVLVAVSSLLRRRLRPADAVGRFGGEEFSLLLEDVDADAAQNLVSRLLAEFSALDHPGKDGIVFRVTFSAGIAMLQPQSMTVEVWQHVADSALYAAKAAGRNCVIVG
jgi:diguanylate cyclase (GGDEF)-like protein